MGILSPSKKRILVMGLPDTGKTYLASRLAKLLGYKHLEADTIRKQFNDWDFSEEGRLRQAKRMRELADSANAEGVGVVADFVCPTEETRMLYDPQVVIWLNTHQHSKYEDTNKAFVSPSNYDFKIDIFREGDFWVHHVYKKVTDVAWDNKLPTVQLLGRWQPWHEGHRKLFEKAHAKTGQVIIMIRDCHGVGDNPFSQDEVEQRIRENLSNAYEHGFDFIIQHVPNIVNITYGRKVGYVIEQEHLGDDVHAISASEIRARHKAEKENNLN